MGYLLGAFFGFAFGAMFTIHLADADMEDGEVITPWNTFYCTKGGDE